MTTGAPAQREPALPHSPWTTVLLAGGAAAASVVLATLLHRNLGAEVIRAHGALVICLASGLFLVAASLRWADHLLSSRADVRARAIGLTVVAVVLVPVHLWVHVFMEPSDTSAQELALLATARVTSAVVVITALMLVIARPRRNDRLYLLAMAAWTLAAALLALGATVSWRPQDTAVVAQCVSMLCAGLWAGAAAYSAHRTETRPWARSTAPLLLLMSFTEILSGLEPTGPGTAATAGALIVVLLSVVAVARSVTDLLGTIAQDRRHTRELERDLMSTRDDLSALRLRERSLAHDARGTLAGIRAAMEIWGTTSAPDGGDLTGPLRRAALVEVGRLEQALRDHRIELGCGPVALDVTVERASRAARGRGAEITLDVPRIVVLGHASDLELGLREVIEAHLTADPARRVRVEAWRRGGDAVVELAFPGRPAGALDLEHARQLVLRQGGILSGAGTSHVRLVIPLCPAPPIRRAAPATDDRTLPRQRSASV